MTAVPADSDFHFSPRSASADNSYRTMRVAFALALFALAAVACADVDRVIRKFDFEERAAGNLEDTPMDWVKVEGPGLPHYVSGALTTDQAYAGRYAFGMSLNGGSVTYRYPAGRIVAVPGSHFRLGVMTKTAGLTHARAQCTAFFANADGRAIKSSVTRSTASAAQDWSPLQLDLTAPADAASLVIELALLQPNFWQAATPADGGIYEQDITGQCWFDDLTVTQVPRVSVTTAAAGNVFARSEPVVLDLRVNDRLTRDLIGRLEVRDADGNLAHQQSGNFDLQPDAGDQHARLPLPTLPAGWYRATVAFEGGGTEVGRQSVAFVQLPDDVSAIAPDARFGAIATDLPIQAWDELPRLLPLLGVSQVKLAVWNKSGDFDRLDRSEFSRLLVRLAERQVHATGCLIAPPPDIAGRGTADLTKLVTVPTDAWQPKLALMMSRYAGHLDRWQFGDDGRATEFAADPKLRAAYVPVLATANALFSPADLAMPWPVYADPPSPAPAALALDVPPDVLPQHLPLYVNDAIAHGNDRLSLTLHPLTADAYGRATQVRDFAQRIAFAAASGVKRIDLPLPFIERTDPEAVGREPADTLLAQRTLLTALAGATYQGRMPLGDDVEALLFDRDGDGVLVAWTKSPQAKPKSMNVMLGASPRAVDLNGNVSPVLRPRSQDGTTEVTVGPTPSLVIGVDGLLARLRSGFAFDNPMLESSHKPHVRRLRFKNPYPTTLGGRLKLIGPAGWTMTPQTPAFTLAAGEAYDGVVTIDVPYSSLSGNKPVDVAVELDSGASFRVPLSLRLGLGDLGVDASAFRDGNDIVVQQIITNYATQPADYTAFAVFTGAARQERLVRGLQPGQTVIKRYRFPNAGDGAKRVRSGVREMQGTRSLNEEIALP